MKPVIHHGKWCLSQYISSTTHERLPCNCGAKPTRTGTMPPTRTGTMTPLAAVRMDEMGVDDVAIDATMFRFERQREDAFWLCAYRGDRRTTFMMWAQGGRLYCRKDEDELNTVDDSENPVIPAPLPAEGEPPPLDVVLDDSAMEPQQVLDVVLDHIDIPDTVLEKIKRCLRLV